MTTINEGFTLPSGLTLKNRLVKAAMTEGLADKHNAVTPELIKLYRTWAEESDVGMLITGNVQVDRRFMERPGNLCIDQDYEDLVVAQMEKLKEFAVAGQVNGSKIMVQISHAGRQATNLVAKKSIGASDKAVPPGGLSVVKEVDAASIDEIKHMVKKFGFAAKVCQDAGFDGIQVHAAHGYQASTFLNPRVNTRTDEYGGSIENRARFLMEIVNEVKEQTSDEFTVAVKLNSSDFQKGGLSVDDAAQVASMLGEAGAHMIELSGGNYESLAMMDSKITDKALPKQKSTVKREAYFLEFAEIITSKLKEKEIELPIMVTGGFRTRAAMDKALGEGSTDLIGVGKPLCVDPGCTKALLEKAVDELPAPEIHWNLPNILGWSFLQRFKKFYSMRTGTQLLTLENNLIQMGNGTFKPMSNKKHSNLISSAMKIMKLDKTTAAGLRGFKSNDEYLQPKVAASQE